MPICTYTVAFEGAQARLVEVQCALSPGMPGFTIVGLPDKAVSEARERIRAALATLQVALPSQRLTINLAPADLPKTGSHFDLPIALAVLAALDIVPAQNITDTLSLGELSLSGAILAVPGALPAAMTAATEGKALFCAAQSSSDAAWVSACDVMGAAHLSALIAHLTGNTPIEPAQAAPPPQPQTRPLCFSDIRGQDRAKRALEIAAAGRHHVLMIGPPGAGKSMLAQRLPTILPPMEAREILETSMIHSLCGGGLITQRPFCDPHHTASTGAIVGGGKTARPGQISLAHNGVLFLDELPEFQRPVIDALRQPLETGEIMIARAQVQMRYPSRFLLIAAANPCRCGNLADPARACARAPRCGQDYLARISGPILDRFDLTIEVPALSVGELSAPVNGEGSRQIATRVEAAQAIQRARFSDTPSVHLNADASSPEMERHAHLSEPAAQLLSLAAEKRKLTARGYHRVIRVARTIADLDHSDSITRTHLAEALWLRAPTLDQAPKRAVMASQI